MATPHDTLSGVAGEALEKYRLVRLSGTKTYSYTRPGDTPIGVNEADAASAEDVSVHLLAGRLGSLEVMVDGAVAVNARAYAAASGYASDNPIGPCIGVFLEAATASGDVIEMLPLPQHGLASQADLFTIFDDFTSYVASGGTFTVTADAGSTGGQGITDAAAGVFACYTDGDDNDEAYLHTATENFLFAANKPIWAEFRVAMTDSATNVGAFIVGLLSGAGANAMQDTEAGPPASYSGVVFYKVSGSLTWSAEVSIGATQTAITLSGDGVTYTAGQFYKLGILVVPTSSTAMVVYLFIDGVLVGTSSSITYTGATEMDLIAGAKTAGAGGTAEELIQVDYIHAQQAR